MQLAVFVRGSHMGFSVAEVAGNPGLHTETGCTSDGRSVMYGWKRQWSVFALYE
jgi:hypothetical protein